MAILNEVEVRVVSKATKQPLEEYDKPGSDANTDGLSVEKYIEAKDGEDFQVEAYFKENFDCLGAWGAKLAITIDGGVVKYYYTYSKEEIERQKISRMPVIFKKVLQSEGRTYSYIGFKFGSLKINEDIDMPRDVLESQATKLGLIEICIERVNLKYCPRGGRESSSFYHPLKTLDGPKELLKNKLISNVMQPGEKTHAEAPSMYYHTFVAYTERSCSRTTFNFRYRSEKNLRLLGCIARSPRSTHQAENKHNDLPSPGTGHDNLEGSIAVPTTPQATVQSSATLDRAAASEDTNLIKGYENMAERFRNLEQQLKDSQERQTTMMQRFMAGFNNMMQSTFATPITPPSTPSQPSQPTRVKRERVEEEKDIKTPTRAPRSAGRPVKRAKTIIDLD